MHDVLVRMKSGRTYCGPLWSFCPKEGWFTLVGDAEDAGSDKTIYFRDVESAVNEGQRVTINRVEDVDLLARARREGWDGT